MIGIVRWKTVVGEFVEKKRGFVTVGPEIRMHWSTPETPPQSGKSGHPLFFSLMSNNRMRVVLAQDLLTLLGIFNRTRIFSKVRSPDGHVAP